MRNPSAIANEILKTKSKYIMISTSFQLVSEYKKSKENHS